MYSKKELKQVLKFLKVTEKEFDQLCKVAYEKVIKNRTESDKILPRL